IFPSPIEDGDGATLSPHRITYDMTTRNLTNFEAEIYPYAIHLNETAKCFSLYKEYDSEQRQPLAHTVSVQVTTSLTLTEVGS
ncbi:hypothetical protein, partial [Salmonella enterica]|uniref:hypothetical protein n=1 Tax=Salmonella enterica TaxID=28901 RepID=UPI001ADBA375